MKIATALAFLLVCGASRKRAQSPSSSRDDVQLGMKQAAQEAVHTARTAYGLTLDYSPKSVEAVEAILAKLHEEHKGSPFPLAREKEEGWRWGAYVGEVILRLSPGHWEADHPAGGKGSFPVRVARGDSFPIGWCRKRIVNGPEDNVWHKFQILYLKERVNVTAEPAGEAQQPGARE